tara:strand:- start:219 stop:386 length:168 start_codon:yes stop_codon:yes gene_type:complete
MTLKYELKNSYFRYMIDSNDKKAFFIGMLASLSAVVAWDLIKYELRILNYQDNGR